MPGVAPTEQDLERPRSPADFLAWVLGTLRAASDEPSLKEDILLHRGIWKRLIEEAYPLARYAQHRFAPGADVQLQVVLGGQPYDARVIGLPTPPGPLQFVEITQAHLGEVEHLRMLHFLKHGHVNLTGPVTKSRTRATGVNVHVEPAARRHEDGLDEQLALIEKAVARKAGSHRPVDTALVVAFDDYICIQDEADRKAVESCTLAVAPHMKGSFVELAVVGLSGNTYSFVDLRGAATS